MLCEKGRERMERCFIIEIVPLRTAIPAIQFEFFDNLVYTDYLAYGYLGLRETT